MTSTTGRDVAVAGIETVGQLRRMLAGLPDEAGLTAADWLSGRPVNLVGDAPAAGGGTQLLVDVDPPRRQDNRAGGPSATPTRPAPPAPHGQPAPTAGGEPIRAPALSVMQPWAWLILTGGKDVENRTWTTEHRGLLAIHAGRRLDQTAAGDLRLAELDWPPAGQPAAARGALVGVATLAGIHHDRDCGTACSRWANPGCYHWQLTAARPFTAPIPQPGRLRLWPVTLPPALAYPPEPTNHQCS
jgi:hypothetical protein